MPKEVFVQCSYPVQAEFAVPQMAGENMSSREVAVMQSSRQMSQPQCR